MNLWLIIAVTHTTFKSICEIKAWKKFKHKYKYKTYYNEWWNSSKLVYLSLGQSETVEHLVITIIIKPEV